MKGISSTRKLLRMSSTEGIKYTVCAAISIVLADVAKWMKKLVCSRLWAKRLPSCTIELGIKKITTKMKPVLIRNGWSGRCLNAQWRSSVPQSIFNWQLSRSTSKPSVMNNCSKKLWVIRVSKISSICLRVFGVWKILRQTRMFSK